VTTYLGLDDLQAMLDEIGVPLVCGAVSTTCLVDTPDAVVLEEAGLGGGSIQGKILVTIRTGSVPGVTVGSSVEVDGTSYRVRTPIKQDDGAVTVLLCTRGAFALPDPPEGGNQQVVAHAGQHETGGDDPIEHLDGAVIDSGLVALAVGGTGADLSAATPLHLVRLNAAGDGLEDAGVAVDELGGGGGGGVTDHGALTGLADDDHTQYHTDARALSWLGGRSTSDLPEGSRLYYTDGRVLTYLGTRSTSDLPEGSRLYFTDARADARVALHATGTNTGDETAAGILAKLLTVDGAASGLDADTLDGYHASSFALSGAVVTDHGALGGLGDDDHSQYHTDARALAWLATRSTSDVAEGTRLYYTDARVDLRVALHATGTNTGDETAAGILAKLLTVDGAASGLDADTLDGLDSTAFAASSHTHDTRYYQKSEFVDASTGATDAAKPVKLNASGLVDESMLPALAITSTSVVASQAAMLALTAQQGDIAIRTDLNKSFVLASNSPSTLGDWKELLTPTDAVLSVFGRTGNVVAAANDYTWSQIDKTTSSLADLATRSASDLSSGTLDALRLPAFTGGDVTSSVGSASLAIGANRVTNTMLRQSTALSVVGRSANSTGNVADLAATVDGHVLRRSGTTLGFGTIATAGIADEAVTLAKVEKIATATLLGNNTAGLNNAAALTTTQVRSMLSISNVENTALSTWAGSTNLTTLGTVGTGTWNATAIGATKGGTGLTSYTVGDLLYASGASAIGRLAAGAAGLPLVAAGAGVAPGYAQLDSAGIADGAVTLAKQAAIATNTILGNASIASAVPQELAASTVKSILGLSAVENTALSTWAGSTNLTTLGTIGTGTWNATTIGVTKGGTGLTGYTTGDILYASGASTLAGLTAGAAGALLASGGAGVAPAWTTTPNIGAATGTSLDLSGGGGSISLAGGQRVYFGGALGAPSIRQPAATNTLVMGGAIADWMTFGNTSVVPATAGAIALGSASLGFGSLSLKGNTAGAGTNAVYLRGDSTTSSDRLYGSTNLGVGYVYLQGSDQLNLQLTNATSGQGIYARLGVADSTQSFEVLTNGGARRFAMLGDGYGRVPGRLRVGADTAPTVALDVTGSVQVSTLTSGRVVLAGTSGLLTDDSGILYDATTTALYTTNGLTLPSGLNAGGFLALSASGGAPARMAVASSASALPSGQGYEFYEINAGVATIIGYVRSAQYGLSQTWRTISDTGDGAYYSQLKIETSASATGYEAMTFSDGLGNTLFKVNAAGPNILVKSTALASSAAGAIEYDGTAFYSNPLAGARGVSPSKQIATNVSTKTMANDTSAQAIFEAAQDTLTVQGSTSYRVCAVIHMTRSSGANQHDLNWLFGGTATYTDICLDVVSAYASSGNFPASCAMQRVTAATATKVNNAGSSTAQLTLRVEGIVRVNAGGTLIPQLQFSAAPGATALVRSSSFFEIWPIGSDTLAKVGNWA
jgi:hypothetical protein